MGIMKSKPLKEVMRENKRMITRAIRELDREKTGLEREEKRLTMEIKRAARENQMSSVKVMAKVRKLRPTDRPTDRAAVVLFCRLFGCAHGQRFWSSYQFCCRTALHLSHLLSLWLVLVLLML